MQSYMYSGSLFIDDINAEILNDLHPTLQATIDVSFWCMSRIVHIT